MLPFSGHPVYMVNEDLACFPPSLFQACNYVYPRPAVGARRALSWFPWLTVQTTGGSPTDPWIQAASQPCTHTNPLFTKKPFSPSCFLCGHAGMLWVIVYQMSKYVSAIYFLVNQMIEEREEKSSGLYGRPPTHSAAVLEPSRSSMLFEQMPALPRELRIITWFS